MIPRSRRDLRLASGLVLFTYVTLHLTCHSLGLVSLQIAETALRTTVLLWHSAPGTVLLYGAAAVHVGLALLAIYERRTLRMPPLEALRILLGITMPLALIGHFVGTRYAYERFGLAGEYARVVPSLWTASGQGRQLAVLAPGWLHGCLGLRFAFGPRLKSQPLRTVLFGAALLLPVLAALGFLVMGRELASQRATGGGAYATPPADDYGAPPSADDYGAPPSQVRAAPPPGDGYASSPPSDDYATSPSDSPAAAHGATQGAVLAGLREAAFDAYLGLLGLVVVARAVRSIDERRRKRVVRISYPGRSVTVPRGWTVLEASRSFGIPHQSMCGGRARCTTCRVRIVEGEANCPPMGVDESRTLDRHAAAGAVRLACQLRPTGDIAVEPVLAVEQSLWHGVPSVRPTFEQDVAVLFFEVRFGAGSPLGSVAAHDTIYVLDRFYAIAGGAIATAGGVPCRRAGDSWLAVFGLDGSVGDGCRRAFVAARRIEEQSASLAERLSRELGCQAEFSLGIHAGPVVAGMIGDGETRTLSAVGDAIDATERLQAYAARQGARFVVSEAAAGAAGIDAGGLAWQPASEAAEAPLLCAESSAAVLAARLPPSASIARPG